MQYGLCCPAVKDDLVTSGGKSRNLGLQDLIDALGTAVDDGSYVSAHRISGRFRGWKPWILAMLTFNEVV